MTSKSGKSDKGKGKKIRQDKFTYGKGDTVTIKGPDGKPLKPKKKATVEQDPQSDALNNVVSFLRSLKAMERTSPDSPQDEDGDG